MWFGCCCLLWCIGCKESFGWCEIATPHADLCGVAVSGSLALAREPAEVESDHEDSKQGDGEDDAYR
jgi:hypothetical protein